MTFYRQTESNIFIIGVIALLFLAFIYYIAVATALAQHCIAGLVYFTQVTCRNRSKYLRHSTCVTYYQMFKWLFSIAEREINSLNCIRQRPFEQVRFVNTLINKIVCYTALVIATHSPGSALATF